MINRFLLVFGALFLLASCETATQDALKGAAGKTSVKTGVKTGGASIFGSAKQTQADKLIAVGDRVLFGYDSSELSQKAKLTLDLSLIHI